MTLGAVLLSIIGYLGILALVASYAEKKAQNGNSLLKNPWMYSLSLAVYCTAWTFYGSVGRVIDSGIDFLTIYIGPLLASVLFWFVLRKIIRISKTQKISSLADFLSNRYGKSISLGAFVALFSIIGVIPYIALQLKSISESAFILTGQNGIAIGSFQLEMGPVVAAAIALFTVWFGLRKIDLTEKHEGIVAAVAFESIIKIVALLVIAVSAFFILRETDGLESVIEATSQKKEDSFHWASMIILSMFAFFLLPRQWQVAVTENVSTSHLKSASWQFPLYLLIINVCIIPIALAGMLTLGDGFNSDYYVLGLPLNSGNTPMAFIAFLGGFAAASGMIVVSTISLATMLTNNIILPLAFRFKILKEPHRFITRIGLTRKIAVFIIAGLAYLYYEFVAFNNSLVSIGLTSFVAVAQFAPSTIGALFWKKGNKRGALFGLLVGAGVWFYMLILSGLLKTNLLSDTVASFLYSNGVANPELFFGIAMPSQVSAGLFWSLLFNSLVYIGISIFSNQNAMQINQAELFVNADTYSTRLEENLFWHGVAANREIKNLLKSFLGERKSNQALRIFQSRYSNGDLDDSQKADRKFVTYTENVLAGVIGSSSARILVSSVTAEQELRTEDVVSILQESKEILQLNKQLTETTARFQKASLELSSANQLLLRQDEIKNEFLYTITHEIRTPITSIRAFTEILQEDDDISEIDRKRFIDIMAKELTRLSRLISQVLDLEKYENGKYSLKLESTDINALIEESILSCDGIISEKGITVQKHLQESIAAIKLDKDKMKQVLINLITNAVKYSSGKVKLSSYFVDDAIRINIKDDGEGIEEEKATQVFDKFYQIKNDVKGNGLGLAISKEIISLHTGRIWVDKDYKEGAKICLSIPYLN